jgi:hypothetical protein
LTRLGAQLFGGAIRANQIGAFLMGGEEFLVIRPGYCTQGQRRETWTQVVHEDVPIFAVKTGASLEAVIEQFETLWARYIGGDDRILQKALTLCKASRRRKFLDGVSAQAPAPTTLMDGRPDGISHVA